MLASFFTWGVSLTHPMLALFFCGEFLLHIPCFKKKIKKIWDVSHAYPILASFYVGSFSNTSRAGSLFVWGFSLRHPMLALFFFGDFLLHIRCLFYFSLRSFSYASLAGKFFLSFFFLFFWGVSLTHPVLASFLSGEFLLHIPCWLFFNLGSFSYTSNAGFIFYVGSFCYTSHAGLKKLKYFGEFLFHTPYLFLFIWGVSLTHPVLTSFLSGEFLLHNPCLLYFYLESFYYISDVSFIFLCGVFVTQLLFL